MSIPLWGIFLECFAAVVTFGLVFVVFGRSEKEITQRVAHLYAISDSQFLRSMGVLLGPALVAGNRAETLLNGDQIFTANAERDSRGGKNDHV
ncbi:hypothetical protein [Nitrosospira briensis]|uniref:hypothetical protein n=1 Tax=Nitrosospira briensis TaxID=35799 RepID=UPI0008E852B2|nr:hypothetical protein [Nitrosospira briensis]SFN99678.1 cardiolipin synthase [Nitrosospira briensis]